MKVWLACVSLIWVLSGISAVAVAQNSSYKSKQLNDRGEAIHAHEAEYLAVPFEPGTRVDVLDHLVPVINPDDAIRIYREINLYPGKIYGTEALSIDEHRMLFTLTGGITGAIIMHWIHTEWVVCQGDGRYSRVMIGFSVGSEVGAGLSATIRPDRSARRITLESDATNTILHKKKTRTFGKNKFLYRL